MAPVPGQIAMQTNNITSITKAAARRHNQLQDKEARMLNKESEVINIASTVIQPEDYDALNLVYSLRKLAGPQSLSLSPLPTTPG